MTRRFAVHRVDPQRRALAQAAALLNDGAIGAIPTDACYALVCHLGDKQAADRLRAIRRLSDAHLLTLLCADLADIATYALLDNRQYRFIRALAPGAYTFILSATRAVPRRLAHRSRKTIGIRVPDSKVVQGLVRELGEPLLATSLILPDAAEPLAEPDEIAAQLRGRIDFLIEDGTGGLIPTTIIDLLGEHPMVERIGAGSVERIVTI